MRTYFTAYPTRASVSTSQGKSWVNIDFEGGNMILWGIDQDHVQIVCDAINAGLAKPAAHDEPMPWQEPAE